MCLGWNVCDPLPQYISEELRSSLNCKYLFDLSVAEVIFQNKSDIPCFCFSLQSKQSMNEGFSKIRTEGVSLNSIPYSSSCDLFCVSPLGLDLTPRLTLLNK
jgi:hypothetical protein